MAIFKCKMCMGNLEVSAGETVVECDYCGTMQTVPMSVDENLHNLFNRANTLRIKSEFDKAEKLYEKIIQVDTTQAEAYWGLILCKYGIEYVDDPVTFKKIPTCHRTSYDSIIADDDYKSALDNADVSQRAIYEEQAREIDRIQKEILALAQKEETYDVFICYKETDDNGKRTQDSVIANDIYYQLTNEGFKVFYAAITLEGKLGSAYEPIIFAALNSAKVMLSIGTKPEYFSAVWVKNEWSRFLKIIQKDRSKLLIPCYRDMDAYELPEEFAHLQAQDMSKIGFINDIVRGIRKVILKNEPQPTATRETIITPTNSLTPLLKRISLFLEDGDYDRADEFCEQVLNSDPENADAYIYKLLIEFKCTTKEELSMLNTSIKNSKNYSKVIRFGNESHIGFVERSEDNIQNNIAQIVAKKVEQERLAAEKAEQERLAAEKAEQERLAAEDSQIITDYDKPIDLDSETTSTGKRAFFSRFRQRVDEFNFCFEKGIEKDTDKAITILKQEAVKGLSYAQNNLGSCYYNGRGVERNYDEAFSLFKLAASKGDVSAQYNLGNCYEEGHGTKQDYTEAVKWYKRAADQGDVDAQYALAQCYEMGQGVSADDKRAFVWYKKAASKGHIEAQGCLAIFYHYGRGTAQNDKEAFKWYKKAAEQNDVTGQYGLAYCYEEGIGTIQDYKKALSWYKKAADQGYDGAMLALGNMYVRAQGVERNLDEAFRWFMKGAELGHSGCQYTVGGFYLKGYSVEKNLLKAKIWYEKAMEQGNERAREMLKKIE